MANGESFLTVKWWAVILLIVGIFGWFFITAMAHENRITKVETTLDVSISNMSKSLDRLSCTIERHIETERRNR